MAHPVLAKAKKTWIPAFPPDEQLSNLVALDKSQCTSSFSWQTIANCLDPCSLGKWKWKVTCLAGKFHFPIESSATMYCYFIVSTGLIITWTCTSGNTGNSYCFLCLLLVIRKFNISFSVIWQVWATRQKYLDFPLMSTGLPAAVRDRSTPPPLTLGEDHRHDLSEWQKSRVPLMVQHTMHGNQM